MPIDLTIEGIVNILATFFVLAIITCAIVIPIFYLVTHFIDKRIKKKILKGIEKGGANNGEEIYKSGRNDEGSKSNQGTPSGKYKQLGEVGEGESAIKTNINQREFEGRSGMEKPTSRSIKLH